MRLGFKLLLTLLSLTAVSSAMAQEVTPGVIVPEPPRARTLMCATVRWACPRSADSAGPITIYAEGTPEELHQCATSQLEATFPNFQCSNGFPRALCYDESWHPCPPEPKSEAYASVDGLYHVRCFYCYCNGDMVAFHGKGCNKCEAMQNALCLARNDAAARCTRIRCVDSCVAIQTPCCSCCR